MGKKATGLGVTEFFLRLMAWFCLRNDEARFQYASLSTIIVIVAILTVS